MSRATQLVRLNPCLIPIGALIAQGYFWPATLYRLFGGQIVAAYSLSRN